MEPNSIPETMGKRSSGPGQAVWKEAESHLHQPKLERLRWEIRTYFSPRGQFDSGAVAQRGCYLPVLRWFKAPAGQTLYILVEQHG